MPGTTKGRKKAASKKGKKTAAPPPPKASEIIIEMDQWAPGDDLDEEQEWEELRELPFDTGCLRLLPLESAPTRTGMIRCEAQPDLETATQFLREVGAIAGLNAHVSSKFFVNGASVGACVRLAMVDEEGYIRYEAEASAGVVITDPQSVLSGWAYAEGEACTKALRLLGVSNYDGLLRAVMEDGIYCPAAANGAGVWEIQFDTGNELIDYLDAGSENPFNAEPPTPQEEELAEEVTNPETATALLAYDCTGCTGSGQDRTYTKTFNYLRSQLAEQLHYPRKQHKLTHFFDWIDGDFKRIPPPDTVAAKAVQESLAQMSNMVRGGQSEPWSEESHIDQYITSVLPSYVQHIQQRNAPQAMFPSPQ